MKNMIKGLKDKLLRHANMIFILLLVIASSTTVLKVTTSVVKDNTNYMKDYLLDYMKVNDDYLKELDKKIKEIETSNTEMIKNNMTLNEENKKLKEEIKSLQDKISLREEYKYVLYNGEERSDITYEQLQFGIDKMREKNINPHLLFGIIKLESKGEESATNSRSSARGYGQFIRGTAKWVYEERLNKGEYNHDMALNGNTNIEMCAEYISYLMEKNNGSIMNTCLDYNGRELGSTYYTIVNSILEENTNTNLQKIEQEYSKI